MLADRRELSDVGAEKWGRGDGDVSRRIQLIYIKKKKTIKNFENRSLIACDFDVSMRTANTTAIITIVSITRLGVLGG